jgi:hypothetical protein
MFSSNLKTGTKVILKKAYFFRRESRLRPDFGLLGHESIIQDRQIFSSVGVIPAEEKRTDR